jgi:DDE superfamily endonuclease
VQRQWCGNLGKAANCVVTVHLSYASYDTSFRTMLDSDLFLPEHTWKDPVRRREAGIPDDVVYQSKLHIALKQIRHARDNGLVFAWLTFDQWYSDSHEFLTSLDDLGQRYVAEIRGDFFGWLCDPHSESRALYRDVETLCRYSRVMLRQPWQRVYLKDTEKGAQVWEFKCAPFWITRHGRGPYWLIQARNVLNPGEEKYCCATPLRGHPSSPSCTSRLLAGPLNALWRTKRTNLA